jgi:hypothetical protein
MPRDSEYTLLHGGLYHGQAQPQGDYLANGGSSHDAAYHNAREACERINGTQQLGALA